jgi:hypothetical protein
VTPDQLSRLLQAPFAVMPGHSRSKNGVASLVYVPGIHGCTAPKTWTIATLKPWLGALIFQTCDASRRKTRQAKIIVS